MKKIFKWTLTFAMIVVMVFAMIGCGSKSVDGITITATPQMSVVRGQSLDLTRGEIEVVNGEEKYTVKMSDEGVEISGLDTSKLGEQEVTVTYKGQTATFKVKVVDRVSIRDYVADYFVGDSFNNSEGRVEITRDNGTSYTKFLNDSKITFEGFDSSKAAEGVEVTAIYDDGTNRYEGKLIVNIYNIEDVQLVAPTKVSYYNHDSGLDLKGGLLKLSGNGGKVKREINLTADMVTGFNLGAATEANKETPLEQKINVEYAGVTRDFTIKITFTNVAEIIKIAESLADVNWDSETMTTFTKEQGEEALRAMQMYYEMSTAHWSAVPKEMRELLADTALAYGTQVWFDDFKNYSDVLLYTVDGMALGCETYQMAVNGLAMLKDTTRPLHTVGTVLGGIIEEYASEPIGRNLMKYVLEPYLQVVQEQPGYTMTDEDLDYYVGEGLTYGYSPIYTSEELNDQIVPMLEYMIELYDALNGVPANWSNATINNYGTQVNAAYDLIANGDYATLDDVSLYMIVSQWRSSSPYDVFELIYTYLYENGKDVDKMNVLANVMLPMQLDVLYQAMNNAIMQVEGIKDGEVYDASEFFYLYYQVLDHMDDLQNGVYGEMYVFFYDNVSIDAILEVTPGTGYNFAHLMDLLKTTDYGYNQLLGTYFGDAEVEGLMKDYIDLIMADVDGTVNATVRGEMIEDLFNDFVAMSATKQMAFLTALNPTYEKGVPEYAFGEESYFDYYKELYAGMVTSDMLAQLGYNSLDELIERILQDYEIDRNGTFYYSVFAQYINEHYEKTLGINDVNGLAAFKNMLRVIESYALSLVYPEEIPNFVEALNAVTAVYDGLAEGTKAVLGTAYTKYMAIAEYSKEEFVPTDLGEWEDEFTSLVRAFDDAQILYGYYYGGQVSNIGLLSSFERIEALVKQIMTAPQEIIDAYRYEYLYEVPMEDGTAVMLTYESVYATIREYYISEISRLGGSYDISSDYTDTLKAFLNDAYDGAVVWTHTSIVEKPEEGAEDYEAKLAAYNAYMEKRALIGQAMSESLLDFMDLSLEDLTTFYLLDVISAGSGTGFYSFSITSYVREVFGEEAGELISQLSGDLLLYYTSYIGEANEANKADLEEKLQTILDTVKSLYEGMADKTAFDALFGEVYELYVAKCEEALNA